MNCEHCGTQVPDARVETIRSAPRWQDGTLAPITCIPCQQAIDTASRALASGHEPTTPAESSTVDSRGIPDYSGPAAPAPNVKVIGPDTTCWPVTVSNLANAHIDATPYHLGDGSFTYASDRATPGLPSDARTQVRNSLAEVGIVSLASWSGIAHARGDIGRAWRNRAREQVESTLRLPDVTAWLAARARTQHEHESDPGQVTGSAIHPSVESQVDALDCELAYMDTGLATILTQPSHRADLRPRPRAGRPEDSRRPPSSLAHVPQQPSSLDSGTRQRQHERLRYREEHSLDRLWERWPSGMPRGAVEVTDLDGHPIRVDLPPWPESAPSSDTADSPSSQPSESRRASKAESERRRRARKRAASQVAKAAASGDVARLAAAQRAAGRVVSAAVSSHPWE